MAYYGGLRKTGQMKLFHWFNPTHKDDSKLPGVIRRGSLSTSVTNLLGSSLESNNSDVPTHIPFENRDQPSKLSDLAKMMYAVQTPLVCIFSPHEIFNLLIYFFKKTQNW